MKTVRRDRTFDLLPRGEGGPVLTFRYLSVRQFRKVAPIYDQLSSPKSTDDALTAAEQVLRSGLRGWLVKTSDPELIAEFGLEPSDDGSEVELPFKPDMIDVVLRFAELIPICEAFMVEQSPTMSDQGNSSSPATLPQAPSAKSARADSAATSPPDSKPSSSQTSPAPNAADGTPSASPASPAGAAAAG